MKRLYIEDLPGMIERDSPKETSEKNDCQSITRYSLDLLCTCVCPLIMIMMSYCYGTKTHCEKMSELLQQKKDLEEQYKRYKECVTTTKQALVRDEKKAEIDEKKTEIDNFTKKYMCTRKVEISNGCFDEEHIWLSECVEVLKHNYHNPKYEWDKLNENMSNWEPIACLGVLKHAAFVTGKGSTTVFTSPMVNFYGDRTVFKFSSLAEDVRYVRNLESHAYNKEWVFKDFDKNIQAILELLNHLRLWYKNTELSDKVKETDNAIVLVKQKVELFKAEVTKWVVFIYFFHTKF